MSKNHKGGPGPVPPANRPHAGPTDETGEPLQEDSSGQSNEHFQEQDPKRRFGDFTEKGKHSLQEPGPANEGNVHHK